MGVQKTRKKGGEKEKKTQVKGTPAGASLVQRANKAYFPKKDVPAKKKRGGRVLEGEVGAFLGDGKDARGRETIE